VNAAPTPQALAAAVDKLRDPATIRVRCAAIRADVAAGRSRWFTLGGEDRLQAAADRVVRVTRERWLAWSAPSRRAAASTSPS
jgi:hypothetical protein